MTGDSAAAAVQRSALMMSVEARVIALVHSLGHCRVESKRGTIYRLKYWEIIADNLSRAGWSWGYS